MIQVKVPATTANMGPGFDALGCALSLYAEFCFEEIESGLIIEGCAKEYQNEENLIVVAYEKALKALNIKRKGLKIVFHSDIPISRGLGSSAALIVGGVMGANAMHGMKLSKRQCLQLCNELEGHPDNVAPALFGGLTACFVNEGEPIAMEYKIHPEIRFCALIPDFETSTHEARKVLPKMISYEDAIFNVSRVAALCKALEIKDNEVIHKALKDRLHQPYRKELIDEYETIKVLCEENGCVAFFISGSGPTCMCIYDDETFIEKMKEAVKACVNQWQVVPLRVHSTGAMICEVEKC